jgi:hypothetical protein
MRMIALGLLVVVLDVVALVNILLSSMPVNGKGSLVIPGVHNSMIFGTNKAYPYKSN